MERHMRMIVAVVLFLGASFLATVHAQQDAAEAGAKVPVPEGWESESREVKVQVGEKEHIDKQVTYYENSVGMEFVHVPAGQFMMGSTLSAVQTARRFGGRTQDFRDEHPRHEVTITKGLLAGACEVTRGQFSQFVDETGYVTEREKTTETVLDRRTGQLRESAKADWRRPLYGESDRHPVTYVTHDDAAAFCKWLSDKEGLTYRLPTEAEWEYMCRAGTETIWWWGVEEDEVDHNANVAARGQWRQTFFRHRGDDYVHVAPVQKFRPNPWGLHDTIGNVWEWTSDWYAPDYYVVSPTEDPQGPEDGTQHVLRGGSWIGPAYCRPAYRAPYTQAPEAGYHDIGFRVVCELPE